MHGSPGVAVNKINAQCHCSPSTTHPSPPPRFVCFCFVPLPTPLVTYLIWPSCGVSQPLSTSSNVFSISLQKHSSTWAISGFLWKELQSLYWEHQGSQVLFLGLTQFWPITKEERPALHIMKIVFQTRLDKDVIKFLWEMIKLKVTRGWPVITKRSGLKRSGHPNQPNTQTHATHKKTTTTSWTVKNLCPSFHIFLKGLTKSFPPDQKRPTAYLPIYLISTYFPKTLLLSFVFLSI